jgi:hypothetical protein
MDFASILSKEYADRLLAAGERENLDTEPVGTGPFRLAEHVPGALVRYEATTDYWRQRAPLDSLVFDVTPDPGVRFEKLKSGGCQVIPSPNPADIAAIRATDGLAVLGDRARAACSPNRRNHPSTGPMRPSPAPSTAALVADIGAGAATTSLLRRCPAAATPTCRLRRRGGKVAVDAVRHGAASYCRSPTLL